MRIRVADVLEQVESVMAGAIIGEWRYEIDVRSDSSETYRDAGVETSR